MEGPLRDGMYPCNGIPKNIHLSLVGAPPTATVSFLTNSGSSVTMTVGQILKTRYRDLVEQVEVGFTIQGQPSD